MGGTSSRYQDLSKNVYIARFSGKEAISPNDIFWNKFLSYNVRPPLTRNDQVELDSQLDSPCQDLLVNNQTTGNFGSLIQVTLIRVGELVAAKQEEKYACIL